MIFALGRPYLLHYSGAYTGHNVWTQPRQRLLQFPGNKQGFEPGDMRVAMEEVIEKYLRGKMNQKHRRLKSRSQREGRIMRYLSQNSI